MHVFCHAVFLFFTFINFVYFGYIIIHLVSWIRLPICVTDSEYAPKTKISIIVPARNEEASIGKCTDALAAQIYPVELFELIVVDDHSTDKTKEVTEKTVSSLKIRAKAISNNETEQGKKNAITKGIKNSSGELIVITDADCQSNSKWLLTIESEYQKTGAYMFCGPVELANESGFLGHFQSLELCGLSLLSGAGINMGLPLLCNGANLAYTREVFNEVGGFKGIDDHPSGDDILLMFKVHKKHQGKIQYVKSKDAFVSTSAQMFLHDFIEQRIRWTSKARIAKNRGNSLVSMLVFFANFLSLIAILCILVHEKLFFPLMCGIAAKILADFLLLLIGTHFFGKKKLLWIFPLAEIFTMLYVTWVGIAANFSSYSWKGRYYKQAL